VWRPAEVDVSIRPGWFYHAAEDARVRTVDNLLGLYFTSVGRNAKLLLNVPPTRDGLLHPTDVARLTEFRARREAMFAEDLVSGARRDGRETTLELRRAAQVSVARLAEDVARGQRVSRYTLSGADDGGEWRVLSRGTTIGHAKLDRFEPARVRRVRLTIDDAVATPLPVTVRVYEGA
jgi:alpha-L-fucosidase